MNTIDGQYYWTIFLTDVEIKGKIKNHWYWNSVKPEKTINFNAFQKLMLSHPLFSAYFKYCHLFTLLPLNCQKCCTIRLYFSHTININVNILRCAIKIKLFLFWSIYWSIHQYYSQIVIIIAHQKILINNIERLMQI